MNDDNGGNSGKNTNHDANTLNSVFPALNITNSPKFIWVKEKDKDSQAFKVKVTEDMKDVDDLKREIRKTLLGDGKNNPPPIKCVYKNENDTVALKVDMLIASLPTTTADTPLYFEYDVSSKYNLL